MDQIDLDLLMEGAGNNSNILFSTFGNNCNIQGFRFKTFNGNAAAAWFGIASGNIALYQVDMQYMTPLYGSNLPMAGGGQEARLSVYGGNVAVTVLAAVPYGGMGAFKGFITDVGAGNVYSHNVATL